MVCLVNSYDLRHTLKDYGLLNKRLAAINQSQSTNKSQQRVRNNSLKFFTLTSTPFPLPLYVFAVNRLLVTLRPSYQQNDNNNKTLISDNSTTENCYILEAISKIQATCLYELTLIKLSMVMYFAFLSSLLDLPRSR